MASLYTVTVIGPAGQLVINESDLALYRSRGYRLEGEPAPGANPEAEVTATEAAIELATSKGVDLSLVQGTGADGRIRLPDVEAYLASQEEAEKAEPDQPPGE